MNEPLHCYIHGTANVVKFMTTKKCLVAWLGVELDPSVATNRSLDIVLMMALSRVLRSKLKRFREEMNIST